MQVRFDLKMVLECWDKEFFNNHNHFSKKKHRVASTTSHRKGAKIQHDILSIFKKKVFSKHQNKAGWLWVLSSDFLGLRTSAATLTSSASATSTASKALFHKKNFLIQMVMVGLSLALKWSILARHGPFLWNGSSKIQFFTDTLSHFCDISVRGCGGQLMLFFWKMVVVPQNSLSQHSRTIF